MKLYTVTAGNRLFWMDLAVRAESREAAEKAFREALQGPEDLQDFSREDFNYGFDEDTISDDGDLKRYVGEVGTDVVMTGSGANVGVPSLQRPRDGDDGGPP